MDIKLEDLDSSNSDSPAMVVRPSWRRRPIQSSEAAHHSDEQLFADFDKYFESQYDQGTHPTLCDMAGTAGFDSVTQMLNHARRKGGKTMRGISRGMLAVAAGYEELAQDGNKNALTLLGLIPGFDSAEPAAQTPQRPFIAQRDINLNISGVDDRTTAGRQLSAQEAYMDLIKFKTFEEIDAAVLETEQTPDGDFAIIDFEEPT